MIGRNVTVAAALTLLSLFPASAKHYRAERYLVQLELDRQGELQVTETAVFHFADGPFTYVYRDISSRRTDGISDITASFDGHACHDGTGPGEAEMEGTLVRWHFQPAANETHTFVVTYTAHGVIRKSADADTLIWQTLPPDRSYEIDRAEVALHYPDGFAAPLVTTEPRQNIDWAGDRAAVQLDHVRSSRDLVLTARFAPNAFSGPPAQWLVSQTLRRGAFLRGLRYGAIPALLILLGIIWWMVRVRAAWPAHPPELETSVEPKPPSALAPAVAGRLAGYPASSQAVLLDLARRGIIRVEQKPGRLHRNYLLVLRNAGPFAPYEEELVRAAFGAKTSVTLTHFQQRAAGADRRFRKAIRDVLIAAGLYDADRALAKSRLIRTAGVLLGFAVAAGLLILVLQIAALTAAGAAAAIAVSLALSAVILFTAGAQFSARSEVGAAQAARWRSFARYLRDMAKGRAALPSRPDWETLLPYAAAMNLGALLVRRARKDGDLPLPAWFGAWQDNGDGDAFVAFMTTSSAGSGGDGGAGAGAASGGGSSGAG